jgi:rhodanese-related sulfurtransferase
MSDHNERFVQLVDAAKSQIDELTVPELLGRQAHGEMTVLIDVREESEWAAGRAQGATHLSRGVLERDIGGCHPDLDTALVLYCGGGFRSALSALSLKEMGYRRVWSLAGGWKAWKLAKAPVEGE